MKLPISWLKEYIDVTLSPEKLADVLTMSGTKVEHVDTKNGEPVLQLEITTNRPDCLSMLGLAREVSVLTNKKIKLPKISKKPLVTGNKPAIQVLDKKGCPLYTARMIENVSIKPAPQKIHKFLDLVGTRPINNAVDATNFVLFETGQPLHAFDADKIKGGVIIVRRSQKNEKFLGIDGVEYTLDEKTLIIADAERPIAIAGVIGGRLTEVTERTKNILLESAYFDPALVRQASRKYKISTDSSYRFERGVDRGGVREASSRAADLIIEWSGGVETSGNFKEVKEKNKTLKITLRVDRIERLLGLPIKPSRVSSLLNSLGLVTKPAGKDKLSVTASSARCDITQEADLIEEVLRIEGFEKIPVLVPDTRHNLRAVEDHRARPLLELRKFISALGFNETINYNFLSEKAMQDSKLSFEGQSRPHKISNALSAELEYFRPSLLPGILQNIIFNVHRKAASLRLFEIGNRYLGQTEQTALGICLYGSFEDNWHRKSTSTYFDLKGALERVFQYLGFNGYEWRENEPCPKYTVSSSIYFQGKKQGTLGLLSTQVLKNWDIPHEVVYAEITLDEILEKNAQNRLRKVQPVPKFPVVRRDIAFTVKQEIPVTALSQLMRSAGAPNLKQAVLFDQYSGKNIAPGKRSLAFSLCYEKETGTFTEEEINALQARVGEALKKEYQVEFRAVTIMAGGTQEAAK